MPRITIFSMRAIALMSGLTFREMVRSKIYGFIVFFALLGSISVFLFSEFSSQEQDKFFKDIAFASMTFFSVVLAAVLGTIPIQSDFESKSIYSFLINPIRSIEYLLGRFLGSILLLFLAMSLMGLIFYMSLVVQKMNFVMSQMQLDTPFTTISHIALEEAFYKNFHLLKAIYAIFLQSVVVCSISMVLSNIFSLTIAIAGSIFLFIAGHVVDFLVNIAFSMNEILGYILKLLFIWVPNFENFNISDAIVLGGHISIGYLIYMSIYQLIFLIAFILIAYQSVRKRLSDLT